MSIGCGNDDEYPDGFLCFIEPSKPVVWKFCRKIDITQDILFIAATMDAILHAEPEINNICWRSPEGC
ncbi:MAG: hypothetical protein WCI27_11155, partial [Candidatus Omnitrophota bacterium]